MPFDLWRNRYNSGDCHVSGALKAGGTESLPGYALLSQSVLFTETGAGTYTGTVILPAGSMLVDIIVNGIAVWDAATSASMEVGDATDPDGFFTAIDVKATDLLAGESVGLSGGTGVAGGQVGAYVANSQINERYSAAARTITGTVVSVGAGTLGRTLMTVVYSVPTARNATKV